MLAIWCASRREGCWHSSGRHGGSGCDQGSNGYCQGWFLFLFSVIWKLGWFGSLVRLRACPGRFFFMGFVFLVFLSSQSAVFLPTPTKADADVPESAPLAVASDSPTRTMGFCTRSSCSCPESAKLPLPFLGANGMSSIGCVHRSCFSW